MTTRPFTLTWHEVSGDRDLTAFVKRIEVTRTLEVREGRRGAGDWLEGTARLALNEDDAGNYDGYADFTVCWTGAAPERFRVVARTILEQERPDLYRGFVRYWEVEGRLVSPKTDKGD